MLKELYLVLFLANGCLAGILPVTKVHPEPPVCYDSLFDAEAEIQRYFDSSTAPPGTFLLQPWRWHTMSLIHESRRLHKFAVQLQQKDDYANDFSVLQIFADYAIQFNIRGLHRIERDLFFPLVRNKTKHIPERGIVVAFDAILDQLDNERQGLEIIGMSLVRV